MTRGGEAFHQRQIRYADGDRRSGGRPQRDGRLAGELDDGVPEAVAAAEPDFIILLDYQTGSGADALRRFLESHPLMKLTPAVRHHRYLKLQYAELTPGPANIGAVEKLARALYAPEAE